MVTYDARPSAFTQLSTTSDWELLWSGYGLQDGIDNVESGGFAPTLDTVGRNFDISAGTCVIKGQLWRSDAQIAVPIAAPSAAGRYDRLVLRLTRGATTSPTVVQPFIIQGTSGGGIPPIVQTTTGIYDIPVCYCSVASTGAISQLVDQRIFNNDSWHPITVDSGWTSVPNCNAPQYRMLPGGNIQLSGAMLISSVSVTSPHNLNGNNPLPANYRPVSYHDYRISDTVGTRGHISFQTSGVLVVYGYPGMSVGNQLTAEVDGIISLQV